MAPPNNSKPLKIATFNRRRTPIHLTRQHNQQRHGINTNTNRRQLEQRVTQSMQPHQDDEKADIQVADRPKKTRRPIIPMTATEAIAMVFVDLGLLILLADYSGLFLIAIGMMGYLYGRLTYKPVSERYPLNLQHPDN